MKRRTALWQLVGYALSVLGGTLLHFLYDITGQSIIAAPFSGVNESTWEHMKLLYFPLLVFGLVQYPFFKGYACYWCVKLKGMLTGLGLIPLIYYTYNGIFGPSPDWINIAIFYIAAAAAFIYEARAFRKNRSCLIPPTVCLAIMALIGAAFVIFTFAVPRIPIFRDPVSGGYGII